MSNYRRAKLAASSAMVSILACGAALAQPTAGQGPNAPATTGTADSEVVPESSAEDSGGLTEIIVTSQRRVENLQNVPLSVVAVSGETLRVSGIQTLEAVNRLAPNAVIERVGLFPGAAALSIRGVGYSGIESFADPDVSVYVNGIYQARNATALSQTLDLASIEVLRGPQGTLFGRNAFAGTISIQTRRAEMGEAEGLASATIGNKGLVDMDFVGNLPLSGDVLAGRVAVRLHNLGGLYQNNGITPSGRIDQTLRGDRIGRERSLVVRPSLRFQPNDDLDIQLIGEFLRQRDQAAPINSLPLVPSSILAFGGFQSNPFGDESLGIPDDNSDPFTTGFSLAGRPMNFNQDTYTLDASYDTGIGTFRLLGNLQNTDSDVWVDTDGSVANIFSSDRLEDYDGYSAELQYLSTFSDQLRIIAGVLGFHDEYKTTQLTFTNFNRNSPAVFDVVSYLSPTSPTCFGTQATTVTTGCTNPFFNVSYINNGGKRTAYAAYVQSEFFVTEPLSIVAGVRYSYERKYDYYGSNSTLAQTGLPLDVDPELHLLPVSDFLPNGRPLIYRADPYKDDNWAPRLGVNYKMTDDILLFAFWQRAFKSGGFNAGTADLNAFRTPYGSQKVDNYEAGFKSEFFDNKLRINVQAFYSKFKDLQRSQVIQSSTAPSGVTTVTTNTADITSYGLEAEMAFRPLRQTTLFLNAAYNKADYDRYCADLNGAEATATPTLTPGLPVCGPTTTVVAASGATTFLVPQDYSGNRPIRAPKFDITGGATQEFTVGSGTLTAQASANYRSSMYVDLLNRPFSFRPSMLTIDGNLRWAPDDDSYMISLWGRNLTNRVEVLGYTPVAPIFAFGGVTAPRTYGVTATVNF